MPVPRKRRHETTAACARCYRLKQKCDRGTPKCLRCVKAGADCVAINRLTSTEVPRSPLQYLEQRLAELLYQSGPKQVASDVNKEYPNPDSSHCRRVMEMASSFIGTHLSAELLTTHRALHYQCKMFYPSERPPLKVPIHGRYPPERASRPQASYFLDFDAQKMPSEVARRLFNNYRDNILPRYPFFKVDGLESQFDTAFRTRFADDTPESQPSNFIINMVLAISCLTSTRSDFHTVAALSERLQQNATKNTAFLLEASVRTLQCLLLLIQMALLLPETVNLWYTSGEAMRMAISLGLHQQSVLDTSVKPLEDGFRRDLFWVTYVLERTVAIAGGCPIALGDEHISTELPFITQDLQSQEPSDLAKRKQFLNHVQACQLQSQIHSIQLFNKPLPDHSIDYNGWVETTKESIETLVSRIAHDGVAPSWLVMATRQCQVLLYRPCSRNVSPTTWSLMAAARASVDFIKSSLEIATAGGFIVAFELCNCCFHAGVVLLYILKNHDKAGELADILQSCQEALDILLQVFGILSKRWPAISDASHYIRGLRESSQRNFVGNGMCQEDLDILSGLDGLVTQRRIHGIFYKPIPPSTDATRVLHHASPARLDLPSLGDDDLWWQEFINADFAAPNDDPLPFPSRTPHDLMALDQRPLSPMKSLSSPKSSVSVDNILQAFPACSYCRDRRMKCHRQLPSCQECSRTSRDCVYYDPVLSENVPFKRISVLLKQITSREAELPMARNPSHYPQSREYGHASKQSHPRSILVPLGRISTSHHLQQVHNHYSFFGEWSSFGLLLACPREELHQCSELALILKGRKSGLSGLPTNYTGLPSISIATELFGIFARSVNVFFPVIENSTLDRILYSVYSDERRDDCDQNELFALIIAVAALVAKRNDHSLPSLAKAYFEQAIWRFDMSCDHSSKTNQIFIFQRTLLVSIYLLLSPGSGDIWRNLGFAIRLFFDLSHRSFVEADDDLRFFHMLTRTLYCLESLISIAFGRPTLLATGDQLRRELTEEVEGTPEERLSIMSYQISFLKMQYHSILLEHRSTSSSGHRTGPSNIDAYEHRRTLDDWFVRWKNYIDTMSESVHHQPLLALGEFHYYHALCILSKACPALGVGLLGVCEKMARACTTIARCQQALMLTNDGHRPFFVYPINWATSHALFQAAMSIPIVQGDSYQKGEASTEIARCLTSLSLLEADPDNLSTGLAATLETLYG